MQQYDDSGAQFVSVHCWVCDVCVQSQDEETASNCSSRSRHSEQTKHPASSSSVLSAGVVKPVTIQRPFHVELDDNLLDLEFSADDIAAGSRNPLLLLSVAARQLNPRQFDLPKDVTCPVNFPGQLFSHLYQQCSELSVCIGVVRSEVWLSDPDLVQQWVMLFLVVHVACCNVRDGIDHYLWVAGEWRRDVGLVHIDMSTSPGTCVWVLVNTEFECLPIAAIHVVIRLLYTSTSYLEIAAVLCTVSFFRHENGKNRCQRVLMSIITSLLWRLLCNVHVT